MGLSWVDAFLTPACAVLGFIGGSLFGTQITRWLALIWTAVSQQGGDFLGPPKRRLLWALPFVALLHPAPYIVCAVAFETYRCLQGGWTPAWAWFFGGFYLHLVFMGCKIFVLLRHWRRSRVRAEADKTVGESGGRPP